MTGLHWELEPSILLGTTLWIAAYTLSIGPIRRRWHLGPSTPWFRQLAFYLGTLCVLLALVSPLDPLADETLFSAHMLQHMLLTFIAPPLWLLGTPGWLIQRLIPAQYQPFRVNPIFAFTLFNGIMWGWHLPPMYDAALTYPPLHVVEHLMLMASATVGWWPVIGASGAGRLPPASRLIYLIPALFSCTALAALITLSSIHLYPFYGSAALQWNLTPLADQQLGGLTMWLPGDMLYLFLIVWSVWSLLDQTDPEEQVVKM
jgi:cytochrome c oxidase assembly factor CtaG